MTIYSALSKILAESEFHLYPVGASPPALIVQGTIHYRRSDIESEIVARLRPRIILAEDLVDSRYIGAKNTFEHGSFYLRFAKPFQKEAIEKAPVVNYARHLGIDVVGIGTPDDVTDSQMEIYFFDQMKEQIRGGGLVFATVGHVHTWRESELVKRLQTSGINSVLVSMQPPELFNAIL